MVLFDGPRSGVCETEAARDFKRACQPTHHDALLHEALRVLVCSGCRGCGCGGGGPCLFCLSCQWVSCLGGRRARRQQRASGRVKQNAFVARVPSASHPQHAHDANTTLWWGRQMLVLSRGQCFVLPFLSLLPLLCFTPSFALLCNAPKPQVPCPAYPHTYTPPTYRQQRTAAGPLGTL